MSYISTKTCDFLKELYMLYLPCLWRSVLASTSNHSYFCSICKIYPGQHLKIVPWKTRTLPRNNAKSVLCFLSFCLPNDITQRL